MRDKLLVVFCCARLFAIAQPPQAETITKPLSQKEKKKRDEKLRRELESPYKIWLNVDVAYIITDEERRAFNGLSNDAERESFIEQFWLRRDPTPDTEENEFKEEHYRRIAYANERFASGIPGWKTDRGRTLVSPMTNWPAPILLAGTGSIRSARMMELAASFSSSNCGTSSAAS